MRGLRFVVELVAVVFLVFGFVMCVNVAPWLVVGALVLAVVVAWVVPRPRSRP